MSAADRHYRRTEKAKADLNQLTFGSGGQVQERKRIEFKSTSADLTKIVFCPICLVENKLQNFLVSTKAGISQSNGECPSCHNGMRIQTLLRDWTPEAYAQYVWNYTRSGFWQKIGDFDSWRDRLNAKGWGADFWTAYKLLNAEVAENSTGYTGEDY